MAYRSPNRLASAMRYVTDALAFAGQSFKAQRRPSRNPALASMLEAASRTGIGGQESNLDYYIRLGLTNPFFLAAAQTIADRVADVAKFEVQARPKSIQVGSDAEWKTIKGHPFLEVLRRPNSMFPSSLVLATTAMWMNTHGNAYWFIVSDNPGYGRITELWPLPSVNMRPDPMSLRISPATGKPIIDYIYTLGTQVRLPGENVIHFRTPNLTGFWEGMAPLSAMAEALETDKAEGRWLGGFFSENNAVPTAVISLPPDLGDEEFDLVKRDIIENFGRQRSAAITRAGDIDIETISHTIEEMQVLEGRQYNRSAIEAVLKVPAGLKDATSGQSRLAADMALTRDAIQPMLNLMAAFMTQRAMPYYEDGEFELQVIAVNVVPQDSAVEVAEFGAYSPYRTINENRAKRQMDPLKFKAKDLKELQPLLDEIPVQLLELVAPILIQQAAPQQPQMGFGGMPGQPGAFGAPGGPPGGAQPQFGQQQPAQFGAGAQAGPPKPPSPPRPGGGKPKEIGPRTSGLQTTDQLMKNLTGMKAWLDQFEPQERAVAVEHVLRRFAASDEGVAPAHVGRNGKAVSVNGKGNGVEYRAQMGQAMTPNLIYRVKGDRWQVYSDGQWENCAPNMKALVVSGDVARRALRRPEYHLEAGLEDVH